MSQRESWAAVGDTGSAEGFLVGSGEPVRIRWEGGAIGAIETIASAPPVWLSPGFIALQVTGCAGHDFNRDDGRSDETAAAARAVWTCGVTTVCTESEEHIERCQGQLLADLRREPETAWSRSQVIQLNKYLELPCGPSSLSTWTRPPWASAGGGPRER